MGYREQLQRKIEKKQEEIGQLHFQMMQAEVYLQGLQDAMGLLPKEAQEARETSLRHGSAVAQARDAILKIGRPMHVSEILAALGKPDDKDGRVSLGGSLSAYVRKGEVFTRPEPNTFGLFELGHKASPEDLFSAQNNGDISPAEVEH